MRKKTLEEVLEQFHKIHGNEYDYSEVEYKNAHTKVKIFCNKCKKYFWQTPQKHLSGQGCPYCKNILIGEKVKSNNEEFIFKATKKIW